METNQNEVVVGLDIGTTKICCIVGRRTDHGKIEILGKGISESRGVRRGMVVNIDEAVSSIRSAITDAEVSSNVTIHRVFVGIAGQHIKSIQHRGVRMSDKEDSEISQEDVDALIEDMYKLVTPPGEKILHVIPQEYVVDNEAGIKKPVGMPGRRLEANFHIVTGQMIAIQSIEKCIKRAKPDNPLILDGLILEPLASADAVLSNDEKEAGVVLVDIGGGTTDVAIFHDERIRHTAVIPFGGEVITSDISEGCSCLRRVAENLKVKFGSAMSSQTKENEVVVIDGIRGREKREIRLRNLAHIIEARMEEILQQVYFEIRNSGYESRLICGVVLTGGGSELLNLRSLTEYVTGMDTRVGHPNEHLSMGAPAELASPLYATAVGLLMKGIEHAEKSRKPIPKVTSTPSLENKEPIEEKPKEVTIEERKKGIAADHSKKSRFGIITNLTEKFTEWLEDE